MNKIYLRFFVGIAILAQFISWIYWTIRDFIKFRSIFSISIYDLELINLNADNFILPITIIFAALGFFIRNQIGWILISGLFYFNFLSILLTYSIDGFQIGFELLILILSFSIILLINLKPFRNQYKIEFNSILILNMISTISTLIFILIRGYLWFNNFEIYKLKT